MIETFKKVPPARVAGIVALLITLLSLCLHVVAGTQAGALWRDEVSSLEVATMRTLGEMWSNLCFDSFPALYFVVLRLIAGVPAPAGDAALRAFGVSIGLLILGVIWVNARWLRLGLPLLSLALIGLNPMIIRYGDSIRAYGLGIALMLLTIGAMWRLVENWKPGRAALAGASAILSVQCLYYNAIILFAVCLGAIVVALRHKAWRQVAGILLIGALAAASLVPYLPTIRRVQLWNFVWKVPFTMSLLWEKLSETLGAPIHVLVWVWVALFAMAIFTGVWALRRKFRADGTTNRDRLLFALVTLVIGTAGYVAFLKQLSYTTQPWYYIALAAFSVTCIEMIFASISDPGRFLRTRAAIALAFGAVAFGPTLAAVSTRHTNIDAIAARIESLAEPDDLILINTYNFGISFRRYYHGLAKYETIPPMEDLRTHRVDILKRQMMSPAPLAPVLQKMGETLRAGKTIWLVGNLIPVPPGRRPIVASPGYDGPNGFVAGPFYRSWGEQAGFFVQTHALTVERVPLTSREPVSHYENLALTAIRGWNPKAGVID